MKKFIAEFKEFISRGSVIDLAVGMVIGSAFTAIVTSLVNDIIMPLISVITGGISFDQWNIALGSGEEPPMLNMGSFVSAIINFLIIALVIFCVVRAINKLHEATSKPKEESKPETKKCPYCCSEIAIAAKRCPSCTSILEKDAFKEA